MRAYDKCITKIKKAAGQKDGEKILNDVKAKRILKELLEEHKKIKSDDGFTDPTLAFLDKVEKLALAEKTQATIEKRNYVINMQKKAEFYATLDKFSNDHEALVSFLVGINRPIEGARSSVATRQQALFHQYVKGFVNELDQENLLPHWYDKKNGADIAQELFELDSETGRPGITNNTSAVKIAKIVKKYQDVLRDRQNRAGAWIQKLPGYIATQNHDMIKVRSSSYEEWKNFILPKLDLEKTFEFTPQDKWDEYLKEAYNGIITGKHSHFDGATEADGLIAYRGPGSIGRRVSQHRSFHFKSPSDWVEYNSKFGVGTVQGSILKGIERGAKNTAVMEKMGPNPTIFYQTIKDHLLEKNKTNLKVFEKIQGSNLTIGATPDYLMKELIGETSIVKSVTLARIGQGVRLFTNLVSLGSSFFSQIPDLAGKASELRFQGRHPLEAYRQGFMDIFTGKGDKETQLLAHSLGAGYEGILHESMTRFSSDDSIPGVLANMNRFFFKLNLMEYWNDAQKMGMARSMSSFLANQSHLSYSQLDPRTTEVMKLYNILEPEWDILRKAKTKVNGYNYIVPELIPDKDLQTKFHEYISDRVDFGILTPGAQERAIAHRGTQAGTWEGELFRSLAQFKMFSITNITKALDREFHGKGKADILGLVNLIVGGTILGYLGMSAKDIVKGLKPRSLEDPRTWKAALLQGGGLGLYGDYMFGEYDRYGNNLVSALAGPSLSRLDPIGRMYSKAMKGINPDTGEPYLKPAEVFEFAKNNTPFLNLFYLRSAMDYLILYKIQENLNPGFLNNMESRIMDEQGREFILPPSQVVNTQ